MSDQRQIPSAARSVCDRAPAIQSRASEAGFPSTQGDHVPPNGLFLLDPAGPWKVLMPAHQRGKRRPVFVVDEPPVTAASSTITQAYRRIGSRDSVRSLRVPP